MISQHCCMQSLVIQDLRKQIVDKQGSVCAVLVVAFYMFIIDIVCILVFAPGTQVPNWQFGTRIPKWQCQNPVVELLQSSNLH